MGMSFTIWSAIQRWDNAAGAPNPSAGAVPGRWGACLAVVVDPTAEAIATVAAGIARSARATRGLVARQLTVAEAEGREARDDGFGAGVEDPAAPAGTAVCAGAALAARGLVVGERA